MPAHSGVVRDDASPRQSLRGLIAGAALIVAWPFVLSRFGGDDVYTFLGAFALLVIATVMLFGRKERMLPKTGRELARDVGIGLAVGVVMTAGTYAAYAVVERVYPPLAGKVAGLYGDAHKEQLAFAVVATLAAIVAEEVLWRGPLFGMLKRRAGVAVAAALSLGTYTLAQSGSGSSVVVLAALVCGAIWLGERIYTKSIVAPLVSHLMWTVVVIHVLPVTSV